MLKCESLKEIPLCPRIMFIHTHIGPISISVFKFDFLAPRYPSLGRPLPGIVIPYPSVRGTLSCIREAPLNLERDAYVQIRFEPDTLKRPFMRRFYKRA